MLTLHPLVKLAKLLGKRVWLLFIGVAGELRDNYSTMLREIIDFE